MEKNAEVAALAGGTSSHALKWKLLLRGARTNPFSARRGVRKEMRLPQRVTLRPNGTQVIV